MSPEAQTLTLFLGSVAAVTAVLLWVREKARQEAALRAYGATSRRRRQRCEQCQRLSAETMLSWYRERKGGPLHRLRICYRCMEGGGRYVADDASAFDY